MISPPPVRDRLLAWYYRRKWRGFYPLGKLLAPFGPLSAIRAVTRYGSQFFLTPADVIDTHVLREGFYESEVLDTVHPILAPGAGCGKAQARVRPVTGWAARIYRIRLSKS